MKNPFQRNRNFDRKLAFLRNIDTKRDAKFTIGGRTRVVDRKPITLARVPSLERNEDEFCEQE